MPDTAIPSNSRPVLNDKETQRAAALLLAPKVQEWLLADSGGSKDEFTLESIADDIEKALDHSFEKDGYKLAKALEDRCGYDPDDWLVNILSGYYGLLTKARRAKIKAWAEANKIVVPFKVGDKVLVSTKSKLKVEGTITYISAEYAEATVSCPSLGHRSPGNKLSERLGLVVGFEDCEKAP